MPFALRVSNVEIAYFIRDPDGRYLTREGAMREMDPVWDPDVHLSRSLDDAARIGSFSTALWVLYNLGRLAHWNDATFHPERDLFTTCPWEFWCQELIAGRWHAVRRVRGF